MVKIQKTGKTWGIFVNGQLIEGRFFSRDAAVEYILAPFWWGEELDS